MQKSESIKEIASALCAVQAELKPAVKDSQNPFFRSSYADLNSIWNSCRALLTKNNLSVTQLNEPAESGVIVETVLMHKSGEWISGKIYLPLTKQDAQGVGSAVTYGRRYGLAAIIGIVADDDDDGIAASGSKVERTAPKPPSQSNVSNGHISEKQFNAIWAISKAKNRNEYDVIQEIFPGKIKDDLTAKEASEVIEFLNTL